MGKESEVRKCKNWLRTYIDYTKEQESPSMFHLWVGISVIASALERKCYIDRGYYKLFPNLFVVLVGASARVRRTTALNIGYSIFKEALEHACLISQKITPEALIRVLMEGNEVGMCGGTIVSSELSVFLGSANKDDSLIQLLTKLYDCEEKFDYHTMARGKEECTNVFMSLIGSTTPEWIKTSMPAHAIGGGFTSRIIFVYQFEPQKLVPFPKLTSEQVVIRQELISDLKMINKIAGEYKLSEQAMKWYEEWYTKVLSKEITHESSLDGYYGRKHDTLLKVAMSMSAARHSKRVIEVSDLEQALAAMNENEKYLPTIMQFVMMTQTGDERGKILRAIQKRGKMTYIELSRNFSYCLDSKRMNEILIDLTTSEMIEELIEEGKRCYVVKRTLK